ncbi:MAG: hypothetical protein M1813_007717 [Trichoglossum hirsutum]|nr:MAG: hypothetical protein M1813_007717 [Trichoglossum hirsutum]
MAARLIIALDYGTTFTGESSAKAILTVVPDIGAVGGPANTTLGVAFHPVTGERDELNVDEIRLLDQWGDEVSFKVPSVISFSPTIRWGFDLSKDAGALAWTKLELEQQERPDELRMILSALIGMNDLDYSKIVESDGLPKYPTKDPVDIVAEYLSKIREYLVHTLREIYTVEYLLTTAVDLVITVPAVGDCHPSKLGFMAYCPKVWTDEAKDRIFHAIQKAGFTKRVFRMLQDIILVTEPEAAAVYSLRSLLQHADEEFIEDLISYCVRQVSPTLELDEVTAGSGAKCGATFIDRAFRKWLAKKLGAEDFKKLTGNLPQNDITSHIFIEPRMRGVMEQFEGIKRRFDGSNVHNYDINLRGLVDLGTDPARGIRNGEIHISHLDLQKLFSKCINKTIDLIKGQIGLAQTKNYKYVFLSGGFGMSKYLQNEVEKAISLLKIKLMTAASTTPGERAEHAYEPLAEFRPWVAVARGAIIRGLEKNRNNSISMRWCQRHYGISVSQPWSTFKHSNDDAYDDPFDGEKKAKDQMVWLIKKGDAILSSKPKHTSIRLCRRFGVGDPRVFRTSLVASDEDEAPQRYAEIDPSTPAPHTLITSCQLTGVI